MSSSTKRSSAKAKAIEDGEAFYFTGKACKYGHYSKRRVTTHACVECKKTTTYSSDREHYRNNTFERQIIGKKSKSKLLGIPFDLEVSDVAKVTHCPVLDIELDYSVNSKKRADNKATIDRFIPELGYVKGNVHVISWRANNLKSNGTLDEFLKIVEWMKQHEDRRPQ